MSAPDRGEGKELKSNFLPDLCVFLPPTHFTQMNSFSKQLV